GLPAGGVRGVGGLVAWAAPAGDRQAELVHQAVGEWCLIQAHPAHGLRATTDLHARPRWHVDLAEAIHHCGRRRGLWVRLHGDRGSRGHDQRTGKQRVGIGRDDQDGVQLGPQHRATSGERISGRARRRRHQDTVAAEGRYWAFIDLENRVEHALAIQILHRALVERPASAENAAVHIPDGDRQGHSVFHTVVVGDDALDGLGEGLLLPLRQETDVSHVDAQHWHVRGVRDVGGSQEGAIAAKYENHLHTLSCLTGVAETWEAPQDLVTRHGSWIGGCHHADVNAAFM